MYNSTYATRGERGLAIVINFITEQGGQGVKKGQNLRTYYVQDKFYQRGWRFHLTHSVGLDSGHTTME